jgi:hypothetical protein
MGTNWELKERVYCTECKFSVGFFKDGLKCKHPKTRSIKSYSHRQKPSELYPYCSHENRIGKCEFYEHNFLTFVKLMLKDMIKDLAR